MAPTFDDLVADLQAETAALTALLAPLAWADWSRATPAAEWTIKDQIAHLAYFDEMTALAANDPDAFRAARAVAVADPVGIVDRVAAELRNRDAEAVDSWFRTSRAEMIAAFARLPEGTRVPWYGPDMSAASSITARIMETWAHGHDVAEALGVPHPATRALRNVAHICARTLANSFRTRGLSVPEVDVRVELHHDGAVWTWGSDTTNRIVGDAFEFCLVGTQRRNVADTELVVEGPVATEWMQIAQAFAGPPGAGRPASGSAASS